MRLIIPRNGMPIPPTAPLSRIARIVCLLCVSVGLAGAAAEPHVVHVKAADTPGTFDGWGTSLCWFANAVGRWPEPQRHAIADALFSPAGLGLTFVRYNIGGGDDPAHRHMPWFRQMESFAPAPGQWNWDADPGQRWMLAAALQRGATRVEAFSNAPPHWMTLSGCASGGADPKQDNLSRAHDADFAEYLATVAQHFATAWGIRFDTIDPLNEPATDYWRANGNQEGCHFDRPTQARVIRQLRAVLDRHGLDSVRISAADETNYTQAAETWKAYDAETRECVAQINAHAYDTAGRAELRTLADAAQRPLVMSEVDGNGKHPHDHAAIEPALALARQIIDDLRDLQPVRWTFWQAVEDESGMNACNGNWGLIHADLAGQTHVWTLTKKYHALAQFTPFIRPGAAWTACDDPDTVALRNRAGGTVVIVTCNARPTEERVRYDWSALQADAQGVEIFRTSASENTARVPIEKLAPSNHFALVLPAKSITTVVVRLANPTAQAK